MNYPMVVGPARQRPPAVTVAGYLLYLVAVLLAIDVVASAAVFSTAIHGVDISYAGDPNHDAAVTAAKVAIGLSIAINALLIPLVVVLAIFDVRGRNGMRITTWVIAGLGVLCLGCGSFGNVTGSAFQRNGSNNERATVNINDIVPSWAKDASMALTIVSLLALIAVIILLALPASNTFFRKTPTTMMYVGYPGYPVGGAYPAEPGYPTYPAHTQHPTDPPTGGPMPPPSGSA
jgi:hypothetical protein